LCGVLFFCGTAQADISQDRKAELLNFLEQDCGSCHGLKRTGGLGSPLVPKRLEDMDDNVLADIILNGIPETAMPPWKEIIAEEEAYFLIKQLRDGLKKQ
jgi:cytochrome c55X